MTTIMMATHDMNILALRMTAQKTFASSAFRSGESVALDFTGIKFMSRAFAHEYLQCKKRQTCEISEINVPEDIQKMFEIVKNSAIKKEPAKVIKPIEINL